MKKLALPRTHHRKSWGSRVQSSVAATVYSSDQWHHHLRKWPTHHVSYLSTCKVPVNIYQGSTPSRWKLRIHRLALDQHEKHSIVQYSCDPLVVANDDDDVNATIATQGSWSMYVPWMQFPFRLFEVVRYQEQLHAWGPHIPICLRSEQCTHEHSHLGTFHLCQWTIFFRLYACIVVYLQQGSCG